VSLIGLRFAWVLSQLSFVVKKPTKLELKQPNTTMTNISRITR